MSRAGQLQPPCALPREGNLDDIGAVLCAIRSMTSANGAIDEEDARAIYSLSCIALTEWRLLDEADSGVEVKR